MHQPTGSLLSLALVLASTSAAPTDNQFSQLNRVPTGEQQTKNGLLVVEKVYQKYGWEMPDQLPEAAGAAKEKMASYSSSSSSEGSQVVTKISQQPTQGTVGSISAMPQQHNSEYLCPIIVGGQTLNLDLDTGSSDL